MASAKMRALAAGEQESAKMDMSPMIDMVFLLLIFFMVTSRLIIIKQDKNVEPPVALAAKPLAEANGRIIVNILQDGTLKDVDGRVINLNDLETICRTRLEINKAAGIDTKLHIRGDRRAIVKEMKKVVTASSNAGVMQVVFATYKVNKY